ncbi:MAG TPA: hypothetical protein VGE51_07560 [Fontimonas sp.]
MALTIAERMAVAELAELLYDFLPGSGNANTAFPIAADRVGLRSSWPEIGVSKKPGIVRMLTWTLEQRRGQLPQLMQEIVAQSVEYRGRRNPLSREEIDGLNQNLARLHVHIPDFHAQSFLDAFPRRTPSKPAEQPGPGQPALTKAEFAVLKAALLALAPMEPQPRGFAFEKLLVDLFAVFHLAPRGSFRNTGEQIDGSFSLHHETYLIEARWRNKPADADDLRAFSGKVSDKVAWSRGLFLSHAGFSVDGLAAFGTGKPLICMDGLDIHDSLDRQIPLDQVLAAKVRRVVETGKPFVRVRDLF